MSQVILHMKDSFIGKPPLEPSTASWVQSTSWSNDHEGMINGLQTSTLKLNNEAAKFSSLKCASGNKSDELHECRTIQIGANFGKWNPYLSRAKFQIRSACPNLVLTNRVYLQEWRVHSTFMKSVLSLIIVVDFLLQNQNLNFATLCILSVFLSVATY